MLFRKIIIPLLSIFATVNAYSSSSDSEDAIFDSLSDVDAIDALFLLLASNIATGLACQDSAYVLAAGLQNVEITIAASQKLTQYASGGPYATTSIAGGLTFKPNDTKYNPAAVAKVQNEWKRHSRRGGRNSRRLDGAIDTAETIAQLVALNNEFARFAETCFETVEQLVLIGSEFNGVVNDLTFDAVFFGLVDVAYNNFKAPQITDLVAFEDSTGQFNDEVILTAALQEELFECDTIRVFLTSGIVNAQLQVLNSRKQALVHTSHLWSLSEGNADLPYVYSTGYVSADAIDDSSSDDDSRRRNMQALRELSVDEEEIVRLETLAQKHNVLIESITKPKSASTQSLRRAQEDPPMPIRDVALNALFGDTLDELLVCDAVSTGLYIFGQQAIRFVAGQFVTLIAEGSGIPGAAFDPFDDLIEDN